VRWFRGLFARQRGPLVLEAQRSEVSIEAHPPARSSGWAESVAIVAHWSPDSRVGRSTERLVTGLAGAGFDVVLVSTSESDRPLEWVSGRPEDAAIIRRPNIGYDFGSWATAIDLYPELASSRKVLLMNDSLLGPFEPFDHLLAAFDQSPADVWGMTDTTQFRPHLQTYCLGFKNGCLRESPLDRFWHDVRAEATRDDVIWRYEIGLSELLDAEYFVTEPAIPSWRVVPDGQNPTIRGWRRLLDLGFPFVKRQLLREPRVAPDSKDIPDELRRRFGIEVAEWL
jgi:hypothetical protein